jgi:exopolyphosphatase/guanosine-5'-triphosphate,3'-diphosphate pyrophosphatase
VRSRKPIAIIDIGSNSVRLVVYGGAPRAPRPIFNEKVLAGLGAQVGETGKISSEAWNCAMGIMRRFKVLLRHMDIGRTRVVATAAVRDAANGQAFVRAVEKLGFDCQVLSAGKEAQLAGEGVLSAIPLADGIVGDLGGGSLELVDVGGGRARAGLSLPLGVLRLSPDPAGEKQVARALEQSLAGHALAGSGEGRTLYLVGGSWRALARVDMISSGHPLPATHGYAFAPGRIKELRAILAAPDSAWIKKIGSARLASTPVAAMLLDQLVRRIRPRELVVSSFGIREGLLYSELSASVRRQDPLIEAARDAGGSERRFGEHGDILDAWIAPLFDDPPAARRIRRAACLLADVAWQASADFRADRGVEMALHGNWVGIDAAERVMIAQALSSSFGRDKLPDPRLAGLCGEAELIRARQWGLAMRLGQRLSAGVGAILKRSAIEIAGDTVRLRLAKGELALMSDPVAKRLERLAEALGMRADAAPAEGV